MQKNVLSYLFLIFILSSCSPAVVVTKVERQYPDKKYLRDCGSASFKNDKPVYSDLVPYIQSLRSLLELCNNDKKALRGWANFKE